MGERQAGNPFGALGHGTCSLWGSPASQDRAGWGTGLGSRMVEKRGRGGEGRTRGGMRGRAWKSKLGWFPPSIQYTGRAGKGSGYWEGRPSSWPAPDPGALTLSPSAAGRSLPLFYYLPGHCEDSHSGGTGCRCLPRTLGTCSTWSGSRLCLFHCQWL